MENNIKANLEKIQKVNYLRLSLTDRCNLNCRYCTPLEKLEFLKREEILSYEEIVRAVGLFTASGIRKLRITGGEPLIKKDIVELVRMLKGVRGLEEIAVTTNGVYLKDFAKPLKEAGLARVNISLDSLKRKKFKYITGFDHFDNVWEGIKLSLRVRLEPVKLNVILMKGINDDEIFDFAKLVFDFPLVVRFIEFFPTNKRSLRLADCFLSSDEAKNMIVKRFGVMEHVEGVKGNGPAEYYRFKDSKGAIGFISSFSKDFCGNCNRIRIDCAGRVSPCLFSGYTHDLKGALRSKKDDAALLKYVETIFEIKSQYRKNNIIEKRVEMSSIGG